jgi:Type II secretion system (T2SS), protein K
MLSKKRASILLIVLITIAFASLALVTFIDRASNDLLVAARAAEANRLRADAYSALEVTLGVLHEFVQADGGALHSPAEGWSDPLGFAGYEPASGRTIEVTFEDESGKLSLPHADANQLTNLFTSWGVTQSDAEQLADALLTWMRKDHVASTDAGTADYDRAAIPYAAPQRSLRSFDELASIDFVNKKFYDENGQPNDLWHRFAAAFSLYDFNPPNLNSAGSGTLTALGQPDAGVQHQLSDYVNGTGDYKQQGPGYFKSTTDASNLFGAQTVPQGVGTQILALRIIVTVHEDNSSFRLDAVVTQKNQAKAVASTEQVTLPDGTTTNTPGVPVPATVNNGSVSTVSTSPGAATAASNGASTTTTGQLNYPFTLLEVHEEIIDHPANPSSSSNATPPT